MAEMTEDEFRDFIREERLRHEQANRRVERWLRKVERRMEAVERKTDAQIEALRDLVEESRAQRGALLTMIDRLGPDGGAAGV